MSPGLLLQLDCTLVGQSTWLFRARAELLFVARMPLMNYEVRNFADAGLWWVTVKKTGQALVFGIYEEPSTPGQCNMIVERLGDYLIDQGL